MQLGKKNLAYSIVYNVIDIFIKKNNNDKDKILDIFFKAFDRVISSVM